MENENAGFSHEKWWIFPVRYVAVYQRAQFCSFFGSVLPGHVSRCDFCVGILRRNHRFLRGEFLLIYTPKKHYDMSHNTSMYKKIVYLNMTADTIWLVVWNIFYFSIYWEFHHPN